jgi:hypothetical protein
MERMEIIHVWIGTAVVAVTIALLLVSCNIKSKKTVSEASLETAAVDFDEVESQNNVLPSMEIEVRGFTDILRTGDGIVGHYDKKEGYYVCSDDEPVFETSKNDYGDKKYTFLQIRGKDEIGLIDENGKIVILPMYASIETGIKTAFINGFCKVQTKDYKYGLIDKDGKIVLPTVYDDIWHDDITDGLIKVARDGLQGFVDLQGKIVIPFKYSDLEQGGDGMIWFMQEPQRWGCINYKNEIVIQPEFTHTAPFANGKAKAQKSDAKEYIIYTSGKVEELK